MPRARAQLDLAEFLHSQATPNTTILGSQRLDTITTSSKLIAEDVEAAELSPPNMRAKQSRLSIISRLLPVACQLLHYGRVHKSHSRRALRLILVSSSLRIMPSSQETIVG